MSETTPPFDPSAAARELGGVAQYLARLEPDTPARWGRMSPQQMVEHLEWTFQLSLGDFVLPLATPPEQLPRVRGFLRSAAPMPRGVVLPGLEELPALRHADLGAARSALESTLGRFLRDESTPGVTPVHPVFGELARDDWVRFHVTHVRHHLEQFDLAP